MPFDLPTPLEPAPEGLWPARRILFKREDLNELGAFKWRGALPTLQRWHERGLDSVVTASTGNHGAAVAWAARRLGMAAVIFAPEGATRGKIALIERFGASVRFIGGDFDNAKAAAAEFAASRLPYFEDGAEPDQYEGYSRIGEEIFDQSASAPAAIVVPVGNGALICGIGLAARRRSPSTLVIGVAAREAPVMEMSWRARQAVACDRMATFADGLAVRVAIPRAVETMCQVVDRMALVSERAIAEALGVAARLGLRLEAAAAAGLAALPDLTEIPGPVVAVVTGGNLDQDVLDRALARPESFAG